MGRSGLSPRGVSGATCPPGAQGRRYVPAVTGAHRTNPGAQGLRVRGPFPSPARELPGALPGSSLFFGKLEAYGMDTNLKNYFCKLTTLLKTRKETFSNKNAIEWEYERLKIVSYPCVVMAIEPKWDPESALQQCHSLRCQNSRPDLQEALPHYFKKDT